MPVDICMHMHACTHAYTCTNAHMHTHMGTHIYTLTHTHERKKGQVSDFNCSTERRGEFSICF